MTLMTKWKLISAKPERLMSVAFLSGFIIDNLTLTRIDVLWSSLVLFAYLLVAIAAVFVSTAAQSTMVRRVLPDRLFSLSPLFTQFAFGALFSGYFVFYMRSASLVSSWLFVVLLASLLLGNEFFKNYYQRFELQVNILFVAIFFFATLYMPIVLKRMDAQVFLTSGAVSLFAIVLFIILLSRIVPEMVRKTRSVLTLGLGSVFMLINVLYFANIIPPIPLVLKEANVYHLVEKIADGSYKVQTEPVKWYDLLRRYHPRIHRVPHEPLYFYSSVFAPTRLSVPLIHEWQYFDAVKNKWVTTDRLSFQIVGGREGGYRGYSVKGNLFAGEWRVNVTTERGQSLGRTSFTVVDIPFPFMRETVMLAGS